MCTRYCAKHFTYIKSCNQSPLLKWYNICKVPGMYKLYFSICCYCIISEVQGRPLAPLASLLPRLLMLNLRNVAENIIISGKEKTLPLKLIPKCKWLIHCRTFPKSRFWWGKDEEGVNTIHTEDKVLWALPESPTRNRVKELQSEFSWANRELPVLFKKKPGWMEMKGNVIKSSREFCFCIFVFEKQLGWGRKQSLSLGEPLGVLLGPEHNLSQRGLWPFQSRLTSIHLGDSSV